MLFSFFPAHMLWVGGAAAATGGGGAGVSRAGVIAVGCDLCTHFPLRDYCWGVQLRMEAKKGAGGPGQGNRC